MNRHAIQQSELRSAKVDKHSFVVERYLDDVKQAAYTFVYAGDTTWENTKAVRYQYNGSKEIPMTISKLPQDVMLYARWFILTKIRFTSGSTGKR